MKKMLVVDAGGSDVTHFMIFLELQVDALAAGKKTLLGENKTLYANIFHL